MDVRMDILHVDCGSCVVRGAACSDCVVSVLLGALASPSGTRVVDFDPDEQAALKTLADSGLVPPLRLIQGARPVCGVQAPLEWQDYA